MSRITFALVVPLATIVLGAVLVGNIIGLQFGGEGCRFHQSKALRWREAGEGVLMQLLFGIGFALALGVLSAVLRQRIEMLAQPYAWRLEWAAVAGFLLLSLASILTALGCRQQPYDLLAKASLFAAVAAFSLASTFLVVAYLRGLSKRQA